MAVKTVSILGVTGSVGQSAAAVILAQPELFDVRTVTAGRNAALLAKQAKALGAKKAVIAEASCYEVLKSELAGTGIEAAAGRDAVLDAAAERCDIVLAAIVGFAGLEPIMAAIEAGSNIALANKEPLVAAGPLVIEVARKRGVTLLPVDSEHNAVFQVFDPAQKARIERIILTASGGPFRTWTAEQMEKATPAQAVAHPNWAMGPKISVDSATLMNKALEVIEAHYLFGLPPGKIDVVIHPQSVIHSMVEYSDGSVLAQMGAPDMKTPIAYCLGWPERIGTPGQRLDLNKIISLDLQPIDNKKYKSIDLAHGCLAEGLWASVAFNAANEVAVEAFLAGRIGFMDIIAAIEIILKKTGRDTLKSVADIIAYDETVRERTKSYLNENGSNIDKGRAA